MIHNVSSKLFCMPFFWGIHLAHEFFCSHLLVFAINSHLIFSTSSHLKHSVFPLFLLLLTLFSSASKLSLCFAFKSSVFCSVFLEKKKIKNMAKIPSVFSLKHFLVLSLALNVSLVMRVVFQSEKHGSFVFSLLKLGGSSMVDSQVSQRTLLATTSSSTAKTSLAEIEDGGEQVINLDQ